jgi:MFS family permease
VRELTAQPLLLLAIAAGVVGQGVMTFVMTATPVSMHIMDGHSMTDTAGVIRAHVLAMYVPSLVSGVLISRLGERRLMLGGIGIYLATLSVGLLGHELMHYTGALILLGVGWNFLFVGGTTLLVKTYQPSERFRAQGLNEAAVFGTSALASLMAGAVLSQIGWQAVLWSTLLPVLLLGIGIAYLFNRPLPERTTVLVNQ